MNWNVIWMDLFGTTTLWGLNLSFWAAIGAVGLIVILMNAVFWGMKPPKHYIHHHHNQKNCRDGHPESHIQSTQSRRSK